MQADHNETCFYFFTLYDDAQVFLYGCLGLFFDIQRLSLEQGIFSAHFRILTGQASMVELIFLSC